MAAPGCQVGEFDETRAEKAQILPPIAISTPEIRPKAADEGPTASPQRFFAAALT